LRSIFKVLTPDFGESYLVSSESLKMELNDENAAERLKVLLKKPKQEVEWQQR